MKKISINLDEKIIEQIKKHSQEMGINISEFIRIAIAEKIKREKGGK